VSPYRAAVEFAVSLPTGRVHLCAIHPTKIEVNRYGKLTAIIRGKSSAPQSPSTGINTLFRRSKRLIWMFDEFRLKYLTASSAISLVRAECHRGRYRIHDRRLRPFHRASILLDPASALMGTAPIRKAPITAEYGYGPWRAPLPIRWQDCETAHCSCWALLARYAAPNSWL